MDAVVGVLQKLGMDSTVFTQFAIFCVLYLTAVPLFIKKLQTTLEEREANTSGLREHVQKALEKCQAEESEYQQKVDVTLQEIQKKFHQQKGELIQEEKAKVRELESKLDEEIEAKKVQFVGELEEKKKEILKETTSLSQQLIKKIAGGIN